MKLTKNSLFLAALGTLVILFNSCDKAESLFLSDSEKLMKDIKGTYNLVSVRHEEFYSVDGGNNFILEIDTTYAATGSLDISNIDKADYTGTIAINYLGYNETHLINGSASAADNDYDKLWIITDTGEDIRCLVLFNPPASYLQGWLDERDDNHLILRFSETAVDYSAHKNRYFRLEK